MARKKPLFTGFEWDGDLIDKMWRVIDKIGREEFKLDYYEPQFEICTSEQMIDAYCSVGMPVFYNHWSFGKAFVKYKQDYENGDMGLAYEMVINSNPCIAYLMEDNSAAMQALVMAHANCGHAHFFKNNYMFQQHTDPHTILDFLDYAKQFIASCEEAHGALIVENLLDHLHLLQDFGVDRYHRHTEASPEALKERSRERALNADKIYNSICI